MKKIIYLLLLTMSFTAFAQTAEEKITPVKNEFKIDAFDLAFMKTLDVSYERVNNPSMGYGVSLLLNFKDKDKEGYYENFAITPFFRMYFFNKKDYGARGFFAEVYGKFASGKNKEFDYYYNNKDNSSRYKDSSKDFFDVSLGMGLGWKWINKNGFILDISLGGGRYLGFNKKSPEFSARGGVSFGYRF